MVKLLDYGALVVLEESGLRALLHISEVSAERVRAMEDVLAVGQVRGQCSKGRGHVLENRALPVTAADGPTSKQPTPCLPPSFLCRSSTSCAWARTPKAR